MTKDYDKIKKQLIEYYQDLLIVQYHDKPKAREVVKANIEEELCNLLEQKVKDAFDVDTAVGVQLDIIGKWVGIERIFKGQKYDNQGWFSLPRYNQETNSFMHGFSTYATFEEEGGFLTYDFILGTKNKLNDNDFRMLIKLKIIRNNIPHSPKPIDDAMFKLFQDTLYTVWNEIAYNSNAFTVVGSPTITEDGVASGFTARDYLLSNKVFDFSNQEVDINFKLGDIINIQLTIGILSFINNIFSSTIEVLYNWAQFSIRITDGTTQLETTPVEVYSLGQANINIYLKNKILGYKITRKDNVEFSKEIDISSLDLTKLKDMQLQFGRWNNYWNSMGISNYDLKQFSITVDDKEVFNGGYNQPMEMTFYYNPKRYGIVKLGQEKNCFPIPTGVKANFVEVKR